MIKGILKKNSKAVKVEASIHVEVQTADKRQENVRRTVEVRNFESRNHSNHSRLQFSEY